MIARAKERFDLYPARLAGDGGCGSTEMLGWLAYEHGIEPHVSVVDEGRTSRRERKKVEMLFAHLKRILKLDRLRLRGPNGARDEFHLAAAAQNPRKLAKLIPMPAPTPA